MGMGSEAACFSGLNIYLLRRIAFDDTLTVVCFGYDDSLFVLKLSLTLFRLEGQTPTHNV